MAVAGTAVVLATGNLSPSYDPLATHLCSTPRQPVTKPGPRSGPGLLTGWSRGDERWALSIVMR